MLGSGYKKSNTSQTRLCTTPKPSLDGVFRRPPPRPPFQNLGIGEIPLTGTDFLAACNGILPGEAPGTSHRFGGLILEGLVDRIYTNCWASRVPWVWSRGPRAPPQGRHTRQTGARLGVGVEGAGGSVSGVEDTRLLHPGWNCVREPLLETPGRWVGDWKWATGVD